MRRIFIYILALLCGAAAQAQELEEDYRLYKLDAVEWQDRIVETDTLLFYRTAHARRDLYDEITSYRFTSVEFARRGHYYTERAAVLNGVDVRHANLSILRRLGLQERGYAGLSRGRYHAGGTPGHSRHAALRVAVIMQEAWWAWMSLRQRMACQQRA